MSRHVAFLRGVSPLNARMPDLRRCFERAGFRNVVTVLTSGNVAFTADAQGPAALEREIEAALARHLDRTFATFVRPVTALETLIARDPFHSLRPPAGAKRVVTFLRELPRPAPALPISRDGVTIYALDGREAFTAYEPNEKGPVFMRMLGATFGQEQTTRTWDTLLKCVRA